jgi:DNA-directed RNA polymerase specialized sigma24 family protein
VEPNKLDGERLRKYAMKIMVEKNIPYLLRDDYAQDAVLHVFSKLSTYDSTRGASVYTWAYIVIARFVGGVKQRWYREQMKGQRAIEVSEFITKIRRHRKELPGRLKPATLRVAAVLLLYGDIAYSEIATIAGIRNARSVAVHVCHIRKAVQTLEK